MTIFKLLANITSVADETNYLASNLYQLLKFIITNVSTSYMVCGFIIVMCMFATTFKNLIYKVLNLAVLSVFVVALWAYMTDITFIYVVYILTFVSAVVMLFLSVVLMLPSSAIAVTKRNSPVSLLIATNIWNDSVEALVSITVSVMIISILSVLIYLLCGFITSQKDRRIKHKYGIYNDYNKFSLVDETSKTWYGIGAVLSKGYREFTYIYSIRNTAQAADVIASCITNFIEAALAAYYKIKYAYCGVANYFKIHPAIIFKLARVGGVKLPVRYLPAYYYNSVLSFVFTNVEVPLLLKTGNRSGFFFFMPYYDSITHGQSLPSLAYNVRAGQYLTGNTYANKIIFIKNFIIFIIVNALFGIMNASVRALTFFIAPQTVELAVQIFTTVSVFFIAIPAGLMRGWATFSYSTYLIDAGTFRLVENLAAIQQGLYVGQPLLLLVSITGLLVALIGAPFFVSRGNK